MLFGFFRHYHIHILLLKTELERIHDAVGVKLLLNSLKYLHRRAVLLLHKAAELDAHAVVVVDDTAVRECGTHAAAPDRLVQTECLDGILGHVLAVHDEPVDSASTLTEMSSPRRMIVPLP